MKNDSIISLAKKHTINNFYIDFPEDVFAIITYPDSEIISHEQDIVKMFKLPAREIIFFEWLKKVDKQIWDDLWEEDKIAQEPYIVSNHFLPMLVNEKSNGYPICDLEGCDNYYFVPDHLSSQESKVFLDIAKSKLENKEQMTHKELLVLEISLGGIDIWHFAYKYKLNIGDCKNTVTQLVQDQALVHLKEAEHLSVFVGF